jgi:hypothetical protein
MICNGTVWSSISIISARAVQCTSSLRLLLLVHNCHPTLPVGVRPSQSVRVRVDCHDKLERPSTALDWLMLQLIRLKELEVANWAARLYM